MTHHNSRNNEELLDLLKSEVNLYQSLLDIEARKIPLYIQGNLEGIDEARAESKAVLAGIRTVQKRIKQHLSETSLAAVISHLEQPGDRRQGTKALQALHHLLQELKRVNLRNYRYTQTSLSFTQSILQEIFPGSSSYNRNGYVEAENGFFPDKKGLKL